VRERLRPNALICKECKWLRTAPRFHYLMTLIGGPLLVPLAFVFISWTIDSGRRDADSLANLTQEMKDQVSLASGFDDHVRTLTIRCPGEPAEKAPGACLSHFLSALRELDGEVVKLSWALDILPPGQHDLLGRRSAQASILELVQRRSTR
jgi:hypothetical protein